MTDINENNNLSVLLLLTAIIFMGTGFISKAEAGLPVPPTETLSTQIGFGSDDAEENTANGDMSLTSSDLEMDRDGSKRQKVGLRFPLEIPPGATILTATVQFTVDETDTDPADLSVAGEATANALTFTNKDFDISDRTLTLATEPWMSVPLWSTKGVAGPDQQTPDLSPIIQEIIGLPGWAQGNHIALIISGSGKRVAESFNGTAAPVLQVEFSLAPQLRITEVAIDTDSLTITGEAFDFNDILGLEVTLGDSSTGTGPGDITFECTSGTLPTDTRIVCDLSAGGLPEVGDYLLTVSTGAGQSQSDEYDLTVGAIGPQGLKGEQGPAGVDANQTQIDALQAQVDVLQALVDNIPLFYKIGDEGPAGGIVFHVTDHGLHGLEAAQQDQSSGVIWCSTLSDIDGVDNLPSETTPDSHSGAHNTPLIEAICGPVSAAGLALNYVWPNGQTDGFLPNKEELDLLSDQEAVVGGLDAQFFWSSSVLDKNHAWRQNLFSGHQFISNKSLKMHGVRAVRAF